MTVLEWIGSGVIAWCLFALIGAFIVGAAIRVSRMPDPPEPEPPRRG